MKINRKILVPIVVVLVLLNAGLFLIDKAVPDDKVKPVVIALSKSEDNPSYKEFQKTITLLEPEIFNKATFRVVDPSKKDFQKFLSAYNINGPFEIIVVNPNGKVRERWSKSPNKDELKTNIIKLTK